MTRNFPPKKTIERWSIPVPIAPSAGAIPPPAMRAISGQPRTSPAAARAAIQPHAKGAYPNAATTAAIRIPARAAPRRRARNMTPRSVVIDPDRFRAISGDQTPTRGSRASQRAAQACVPQK